MKLAMLLTMLRKAKGLSREALAQQVGITGGYLFMLETGVRSNPSLPVLRRLAKALGVSVSQLIS
jgi:transcriptional regulator with XRE-family HTH domain